jgi:hypothetical protein
MACGAIRTEPLLEMPGSTRPAARLAAAWNYLFLLPRGRKLVALPLPTLLLDGGSQFCEARLDLLQGALHLAESLFDLGCPRGAVRA